MAARLAEWLVLLAGSGLLAVVEGALLGVVGGLIFVRVGVETVAAALFLLLGGLAAALTFLPTEDVNEYDVYDVSDINR